LLRALLAAGVPYQEALALPVDLALALLDVGPQRQMSPQRPRQQVIEPQGPRFVATRRKSRQRP
jgi:hypothetical protein